MKRILLWALSLSSAEPQNAGWPTVRSPLRFRLILLGLSVVVHPLCARIGSAQALPESAFRAKLQNARASRLLGQHVEDPDGERLGTVRNLILDARGGRVKYVIVAGFGLPGISPRRVVPAQAFSGATTKKATLELNVSKARWERAPRFKGDLAWLAQPKNALATAEFYVPATQASAKPQPGSGVTHSKPQPSRSHPEPPAQSTANELQLASELLSKGVVDSHLKPLGHISDLLVDLNGSNPAIAVLSTSTILGKGSDYAVPLQMLTSAGPQLRLDATPAQLTHAQPFTPQAWSAAQSTSSAAIYRLDREKGLKW